jgi:hypothetical protein
MGEADVKKQERRGTPISGSIEDVVVSDLLQFIQLGKRTGTLVLRRRGETARVGFHGGRLIAASAPRTSRVRDVIVSLGLIDGAVVERLASEPGRSWSSRALSAALVNAASLSLPALRGVVEQQMEEAVAEILRWESGSFDFVLDDLESIDDLVLWPDEAPGDEVADTRSVIIEATRIFHARSQRTGPTPIAAASPRGGESALPPTDNDIDMAVSAIGEPGPHPAADLLELQVVSPDASLAGRLQNALEEELASVRRVPIQHAGEGTLDAPPPIVLIDVRGDDPPSNVIGAVRVTRPRASVVALVDSSTDLGATYAAGALAVVPAEVEAITSCVKSIIENRRDLVRGRRTDASRAGVARLRRMMDDLRSGVMSTSMALNLMHVISESVERAVLFVVKGDEMAVLGAFGHDAEGRLLASSTRGLRLQVSGENALVAAINDGSVVSTTFAAALLPGRFAALVGRPRSDQVVVFPVLGAQRVIAVVYADNGALAEKVHDIEILELAAAQVGIAFENELLRRQLSRR